MCSSLQHHRLSVTSSHFSGDVYYGEYPLAFAACLGFESIYDFLLDHGADPNLQDSYGNTVLHMCVIKNKPAMYSYAARHPVKKADQWKKNFRRYDSWPSKHNCYYTTLIPLAAFLLFLLQMMNCNNSIIY